MWPRPGQVVLSLSLIHGETTPVRELVVPTTTTTTTDNDNIKGERNQNQPHTASHERTSEHIAEPEEQRVSLLIEP
uniref:Putative secreted protein n=1 Tax=Anopheles triannulatus TaxID=58253 RepID=A0A2M4B7B0_9DIPT